MDIEIKYVIEIYYKQKSKSTASVETSNFGLKNLKQPYFIHFLK